MAVVLLVNIIWDANVVIVTTPSSRVAMGIVNNGVRCKLWRKFRNNNDIQC